MDDSVRGLLKSTSLPRLLRGRRTRNNAKETFGDWQHVLPPAARHWTSINNL